MRWRPPMAAASPSQRAGFWKLRDEMSAAQKPEGGSIKHDISVPVAAVPAFIEEANAAVVKLIPGSRPVPFGHLGDGNIHYNVSQPIGGNTADFMSRWHEVNEVVFAIVAAAMVGYAGYRGWVDCVASYPAPRAKGYGPAIINAAEDWLRAPGIAKLPSMVRRAIAKARAFYQSIG